MRIDRTYRSRAVALVETVDGLRDGRLSRRKALRLLGGAGVAGAGFVALGRRAFAQEGTPPAVATPQLGLQADGSTLWRVKVGDMRMEERLELMDSFPGEITITGSLPVNDKGGFKARLPNVEDHSEKLRITGKVNSSGKKVTGNLKTNKLTLDGQQCDMPKQRFVLKK